jgi:colanic acid/amylovoran biosynthesis glycosyltransferase
MTSKLNVAYLAPQLTALEATFIYEEIAEVEKGGINVVPFSVNRPKAYLVGNDSLLDRTQYLYDKNTLLIIIQGLLISILGGKDGFTAFRYLMSDVKQVGFFSTNAVKLVFQFFTGAVLSRELKSKQCHHLHIHFAHVATQIGMYSATMAGIPFTVMAHANDIFERGLLLKEKSERAKGFFTISHYNKHYLVSRGLNADNISIIRCGVAEVQNVWCPEKQASPFVLGTLGRLVEKKGISDLISAVAELTGQGHHLKLLIGGDGPLLKELKEHAKNLGIQSYVVFEGMISREELDTWMSKLDAFALACKRDQNGDQDGIPVVLMEAMIRGLPVLSTKISGITELIIDSQTGYLAEPDDVEDLSRKLKKLVSRENSLELSKNGKIHVLVEFGRKINVERLVSHF